MMSSNFFRSLAIAGSLGTLTAPAEAAVYQASTPVSWDNALTGLDVFTPFSLPQYSGPGTIVGVNIALSGSALAADDYNFSGSITVAPYTRTWSFDLVGPPDPSVAFLNVVTTAKYPGASCAAATDPGCAGFDLGFISISSGPNAFSGSVNVSDFSDYAGSGTNAFDLISNTGALGPSSGSATVTETILTSVPEAPTWAMALIGFAIVGFAAQSNRPARLLAARRL